MVTIKVNVEWCEKNFCACVDEQVPGAIVVTHKTYKGLKDAVHSAIRFHVEGMIADGDDVPGWLLDNDYKIEWVLDTAALLKSCEGLTTLSDIANASGINERQLGHYANGHRKPRPEQRKRIVDGLHKIANELLAVV